MSEVIVTGSGGSAALTEILLAQDIEPGSDVSYTTCKTILLYHPLGRRLAGGPVKLAQSQPRQISCPDGPEDRVVERFIEQWTEDNADEHIASTATQARAYGAAVLAFGARDIEANKRIDPKRYAKLDLFFSTFDPLNVAGSLVTDQNPNSPTFQKTGAMVVNGVEWHRSRTVTLLNEEPIYIAYTNSAYGYTGRSVYQRALYPLKSFVQSMVADDMVLTKLGLLIAKMMSPGSILDKASQIFGAIKRTMLQGAATGNVLSIDPKESVETLNMMNVDGAGTYARTNVIKNIATAADMPATLLLEDTLAEGFGEGTEDARRISQYVKSIRTWLQPLYAFMDEIIQRRAWNEEFYRAIQAEFPDRYSGVPYETAFQQWRNSFKAIWPNLIEEPDSEQVKVEEIKYKSVIGVAEVMLAHCDPVNKAKVLDWLAQSMNDNKKLFQTPLNLDIEALEAYVPPEQQALDAQGDGQPRAMSYAAE